MIRVLAFRHVPFEGLGLIAPVLEERGIFCDYADLYRAGQPAPDIAGYDGLIFMGGPMSVNDPLPFIDQEICCIRHAAERGQPMLGVCLGSQLIARALGAGVHRSPAKEIGWFDIHFTGAAATDPVFSGLTGPENVFHWHGETWDLPPGAIRLAYSPACPNQAFRAGANIYGLQFHLEVTPAMIADWQTQDENCGDVCELATPLDPARNAPRMQELSKIVFGRWCEYLYSTPT
ncbi:MAG TPA: gamma-glutamyl-gamma-aminobutyrate hydrolase family protein [Bryobacteraceae bacterium]|nr:gamma-glutamyl-gamma-aminobutyrate hydrolase family protein [Bryobacteraceae bacterium]